MPTRCRLAPLVLATALLAETPAYAQDAPVQRAACAGRDIVPSGFRSPGRPTRLLIQERGRLLATVTDWSISSVECDDMTGDGIPELMVRTYSGGAHCCETVRVYALAGTPRLLLLYKGNNAIGAEVRDVDGDGRRELILGDDSFAYFDDLCYACSPAYLPLAACYTGVRFEDCTRQFPGLLRDRRNVYLARLAPSASDETLKEAEGAALGVLAVSELLGEEQEGLEAVRKAAQSEAVTAWLSKALPQVRQWATTRGKKLQDGP